MGAHLPQEPVPDLEKRDLAKGPLPRVLRGRKGQDLVTLGVVLAAIALFVATASNALLDAAATAANGDSSPNLLLTAALLLNIALILLGWNRYKALTGEIAQHRRLEEEARRLADYDDLTGCLNRRSLAQLLDAMLQERTGRKRAVAAIAIDLDNFKQVNDLNGHAMGDAVLSTTAKRIIDLLPEEAMIARLGGDEFLCVVPYNTDASDRIDLLATRIIEQISRPVVHQGSAIEVTISIGSASSLQIDPESKETPAQDLMHKADIAMYHAKKKGKNRFYWFEPPMENELRFRNELEAGIRRGVQAGEFVPYYEQQIDLDSGRLVGFEMLARWDSPELGMVTPEIFIPIAEEIGVIAQMSEQLIEAAFADASQWDPDLTLSVNISPVQMRDPWFAQKILKLLVKHRFPAHRLEIEITETCLHENIGMVRSMITSLRNQGVKVSLDDFGTGYASLSQLRSLPFDRLKIDRSFIRDLNKQDSNDKLVDAIISMSDGLKLPITAEGIENADILDALGRWGKLKGQGYHYGRPEPAQRVLERLAEAGRLANDAASEATVLPLTPVANSDDKKADGGSRAG